MGLFDFRKKKKESTCRCGGNSNRSIIKEVKFQKLYIKILGSGCAKCNELESNVKEALIEIGMDINIEHVTDFIQIAKYGVMTTPSLVINGKIICSGKVIQKSEIIKILKTLSK